MNATIYNQNKRQEVNATWTFRKWFYQNFSTTEMETKCRDIECWTRKNWKAWYFDLVANSGIRKYANFDSFVISDIEKELSEYQF